MNNYSTIDDLETYDLDKFIILFESILEQSSSKFLLLNDKTKNNILILMNFCDKYNKQLNILIDDNIKITDIFDEINQITIIGNNLIQINNMMHIFEINLTTLVYLQDTNVIIKLNQPIYADIDLSIFKNNIEININNKFSSYFVKNINCEQLHIIEQNNISINKYHNFNSKYLEITTNERHIFDYINNSNFKSLESLKINSEFAYNLIPIFNTINIKYLHINTKLDNNPYAI